MGVGVNGNLIPPKKGEVRNPNGKPKGLPNSRTRYMRLLALTEQIKNPVTGGMEEFSILEQLDMQMIAKARKGDLNAYKEIMDRLEGKAAQPMEIQHNGIALILEKYGLPSARQDQTTEDGSSQDSE